MPLPIAVQLYSFRDPARFGGQGLGLDRATLAAIAEAGFLGVETVDVPGGDPAAARRALEDLDLNITSAHTWTDVGDIEAFRRASAAVSELGARRIIVSPRVDPKRERIAAVARRLRACTDVAAGYGLRLGFHNHSAEMALVDGKRTIDWLAEEVEELEFQVDIFWVVVGGASPAEVIGGLGRRVVSLHVKDGLDLPRSAYEDAPFVNVPVGAGIVDPAPSVAAAEAAASADWLIVEFDHVEGSAIDGVRRSLENLTARGLARRRATS